MAGHDVQLLRSRDHLDRGARPAAAASPTTPANTTAPSAPTLSLTGNWPVRISVAWTASVDDVGSQVWYTLLVNGTSYGADQIGYRSALVLDRAPETTYTLQVTVRDFFGPHPNQSNVVTVTPAVTDRTPPTTPTNLLSPQACARDLARVESSRRTTPIRPVPDPVRRLRERRARAPRDRVRGGVRVLPRRDRPRSRSERRHLRQRVGAQQRDRVHLLALRRRRPRDPPVCPEAPSVLVRAADREVATSP